MKLGTLAVLFTATVTGAFAQQHWDFGVVGGSGLLNNTSATGGATAGFAPGIATGVFVGDDLYKHFSGELRYEWMQSDLRLSSGGQSAQFSGMAHAIHYDFIYHTTAKESKTQFFAAAGGGLKAFMGTGAEQAYQPLSQFGYFTKTNQVKPMVDAGVGVVYRIAPRVFLRTEVRAFITGFPTGVLTPPPGVTYGKMLYEFVPLVGIQYVR